MTSDPFQLNAEKTARKHAQQQRIKDLQADYQEVFGTAAGKRVFWDLLGQTYIFQPFGDQNAKAYAKEGRREIGLYILAACGFNSNSSGLIRLVKMLQEASRS